MISSLPTIAKAAEKIRSGEITPIDLVEFCLARIDRFDDQIHAWVMVDRAGALKQAAEQTELLRQGVDSGPLTGIPIGIKDIIDVAGWPTKAGSPLREDHVAEADAQLVAFLRQAGAIILGKTVTTQFACFDPPPTRNPWNLQHTPGGSSSGSAAAVASEMCMAAIGTQTGGSIIRPASYCGVAGFKPTFGHISLDGVVPVSKSLDHAGPIARCVSDLAAMYAVAVGSDIALGRSPVSIPCIDVMHSRQLPPGMKAALAMPKFWHEEPAQPALHIIDGFYFDQASPEVCSVVRPVIHKLQTAWSEEACIRLPASFGDLHVNHYRIMAYEAADYHRQAYAANPSAYGENISKLLDDGTRASREDYLAALEHKAEFASEFEASLGESWLGLTPSTNTTAPASLETTGDPKFNSPWSYAGVPAITIPCGIASDGMPCGLQLVGPRNSDARLLQAAAWCEKQLGLGLRPTILSDAW